MVLEGVLLIKVLFGVDVLTEILLFEVEFAELVLFDDTVVEIPLT